MSETTVDGSRDGDDCAFAGHWCLSGDTVSKAHNVRKIEAEEEVRLCRRSAIFKVRAETRIVIMLPVFLPKLCDPMAGEPSVTSPLCSWETYTMARSCSRSWTTKHIAHQRVGIMTELIQHGLAA